MSLQEGARTLNPDDGLPAKGEVPVLDEAEATAAAEAEAEKLGALKRPRPPSALGLAAKKPKTTKTTTKPTTTKSTYIRKVGTGNQWEPWGYAFR